MLLLGVGFKYAIVNPPIRHGVIPLVIATLGLSLGMKQLVKAGYSAEAHPFPSPFPAGQLSLGGAAISYADIGTLLLAGLIVIGLQTFLNRTVTGRAMQAVAQNTDAAKVLGIDVNRMVLYTFLINAVLACVAALLVTPTYLAKFDMGDSIGLKAFFAAIIGGFNQTRGALLGGVLIGILENVVGFTSRPLQGRRRADAVLARHPGPPRRSAGQGRGAQGMKTANKIVALVVGLAAFAVLPVFLKSYGVYLCTLFCVTLMATYGLNLTVGYAGQMSLGQAAFYGIGAYIAAIALKAGAVRRHPPLAAVACFIVGLALASRLRVRTIPRVRDARLQRARVPRHAQRGKITGGTFGISGIPRPHCWTVARRPFFWFTLFATVVLIFLLWWLLRSPWGRAFAALRDNPIRAESLGVNITAYTLLAFAIGAACAGIAGVFFAALVQFVEPAPFHFSASLMMLLAVIVGGSGRFFGPVLGTVIIVLLPEWLRFMQNWYLAVFGFAIVALMIWLPGGIPVDPDRMKPKGATR
jgi:branched-chain amino acid transport system permease protein